MDFEWSLLQYTDVEIFANSNADDSYMVMLALPWEEFGTQHYHSKVATMLAIT